MERDSIWSCGEIFKGRLRQKELPVQEGVELISLQLQGHPRSKEKAFQTSCCQQLPDFGSLERQSIPNIKCRELSLCHHQILQVPADTRELFLSRLNSHSFPTPPLLETKQSIRALLSGSDISQVWINTSPGPVKFSEDQLILCASLPIAAPAEEEPQHLPAQSSGHPEWFSKVLDLPWKGWRGNDGMV